MQTATPPVTKPALMVLLQVILEDIKDFDLVLVLDDDKLRV